MSEINADLWQLLFEGLWLTIQLTVFSAALAFVVAFVIGIARTHRLWIVRFVSGVYFEAFRGTSALVFLIWVFFVVPLLFGIQFVPLWAAVLGLGLTYGAYGSEVVRGSLAAVAPAQREAAIALSFSPVQQLRKVIVPQAWPEMIPPFNNLLIELLKGTALVSVLGVGDVAFKADLIRNATGNSAPVYTIILVMYFVVAFVLTRLMRAAERKAKAGIGQKPTATGLFHRKLDIAGETTQARSQSAGGASA